MNKIIVKNRNDQIINVQNQQRQSIGVQNDAPIRTEFNLQEKEFKKTYSDSGYLIRKIGTDEFYEEAIDLPNTNFEYEETEIKIEEEV